MAEEELKLQEEADDRLINDAFQKLLNDYLSSRHRNRDCTWVYEYLLGPAP